MTPHSAQNEIHTPLFGIQGPPQFVSYISFLMLLYVTNYQNLGDLKQHGFVSCAVLGVRGLSQSHWGNIKISARLAPSGGSRERIRSLAFSMSGGIGPHLGKAGGGDVTKGDLSQIDSE